MTTISDQIDLEAAALVALEDSLTPARDWDFCPAYAVVNPISGPGLYEVPEDLDITKLPYFSNPVIVERRSEVVATYPYSYCAIVDADQIDIHSRLIESKSDHFMKVGDIYPSRSFTENSKRYMMLDRACVLVAALKYKAYVRLLDNKRNYKATTSNIVSSL